MKKTLAERVLERAQMLNIQLTTDGTKILIDYDDDIIVDEQALLTSIKKCKTDILRLLAQRQPIEGSDPELGPEPGQALTDQCLCGVSIEDDPEPGRYLALSEDEAMYQCSACMVRCASIRVSRGSIEAMQARVLAEYAARPQEEQAQQIERRDFWQHIKQVVGDRPDYEPPAGCYDHISGGRSGYAALYSKKQ